MWGEIGGARLPAEPDSATEFPVPKPSAISWNTRHCRAVGKYDRRTRARTINLQSEKSLRIIGDARKFFLGCFRSKVVGRPSSLQSVDVARQVLSSWPNELHLQRDEVEQRARMNLRARCLNTVNDPALKTQ
jgi:hypothetical protein